MALDDEWVDYRPAPAQASADEWVDYTPPVQQARAPAPAPTQDEWVDYKASQTTEPVPEAQGQFMSGVRQFVHDLPGALGGAAGGALVGGAAGAAGGNPLTVIGGALAGGLAGGFIGEAAKDAGLKLLGMSDSEALQLAVNAKANPVTTTLAGAGTAVAGGTLGAVGKGVRALSGGIGGAFETGRQLYQGEELDPLKIGATAAGGTLFAKNYGWMDKLAAQGGTLGARWRDRPRAQSHGAAGPDANASTAAEPPPVSKKEDVGFENPISVGSEKDYSIPRDSATGEKAGVTVKQPGELDPAIKAAVDAENPPVQAETPPLAAETPPPAAEPQGMPPPTEQPQGVSRLNAPVAEPPQGRPMGEQPTPPIEPAPPSGMSERGQEKLAKARASSDAINAREDARLAEWRAKQEATEPGSTVQRPRLTDDEFAGGIQALTDQQREAGGVAPLPTAGQQARNRLEAGVEATRGRTDELPDIPSFLDRRTPKPPTVAEEPAPPVGRETAPAAEKGPLYPHASLKRPKLEAELKKAEAESSKVVDEMIEAGRGREQPSETRNQTDDLSRRYMETADRVQSLHEEIKRREKYHGKRTPIPGDARDTFYGGPLRQDVIERGRSGRPIETERLPIGTEPQILEVGAAKATGPKGEPREPEMLAARRKGPDEPDATIDAAVAGALDRGLANKIVNQPGVRLKEAKARGVTPETLKAEANAVLRGQPMPLTATGGGSGVPPGGTAPSAAAGGAGAPPPTPPGGTPPIPPNVGAAAAAGAGGGGGPTTPNMGHTPPQQQSWLKELWRDVKRKTAAHTLGPEAMEARYLIRSSSGEKHRLAEQTIDLIRGHKDHIDSMSPADHAALIDHAQGGNHFPNFQPTAEQKLYLQARERAMQEWEAVLHQLPAADQMQFREKFMAQMYENPQAAGGRVFTGMGKRGSAGSTKHRKYDTYMDAEAAGLIRKYNNPIEIDSRYINSIKDFVISRDVVQRGADAGIIQWFDNPKIVGASGSPEPLVTGGPPPGMKELIGVPMKGNSKTAYAPDDFADVYNNFYDKGFGTTPEKATVVEAVRNSANAWTSLELGLNAYHLFTMANEAIITDLTKGFNNILVGQVRKGFKQIAMSPLAPETMRREGKKFQQEYLDPNSTNPIAMILAEANARPIGRGHAADYTFQERGAFINKLSNIEGQLKQARKEIGEDFNKAFGPNATESKILFPLRQAGRILQTTAAPIFDKYIPMLKAGAVHSQFKDWHEAMVAKNPAFDMVNNPADRRTAVNAGMKIVDSVDNRFGEAIHDNAFMNGMLKQGLMTMMRSYSWTVGAMKEIGGGSAAAGQALYTLGKTRGAENRFDMTHKDWDPRMAYPLALMFAVSTVSTIYQMLRAGEAPESWRDLYAPKTGGTVPGVGGKGMVKEHVLMPGYQKDVLGWAMHPAQEAYNKMGGLPTTAIEQLTGKDWRGDPIVRADANALEGFGQRLGHVLGKLSPISVKNMTKGSEPTSAITWPEKAIGFRAPGAHIQDPEGLKRAMTAKDRRIQKAIDKRERKIQLRQNPQQAAP